MLGANANKSDISPPLPITGATDDREPRPSAVTDPRWRLYLNLSPTGSHPGSAGIRGRASRKGAGTDWWSSDNHDCGLIARLPRRSGYSTSPPILPPSTALLPPPSTALLPLPLPQPLPSPLATPPPLPSPPSVHDPSPAPPFLALPPCVRLVLSYELWSSAW